jgi:hypothetical protein
VIAGWRFQVCLYLALPTLSDPDESPDLHHGLRVFTALDFERHLLGRDLPPSQDSESFKAGGSQSPSVISQCQPGGMGRFWIVQV